jgi:hypothetical protein
MRWKEYIARMIERGIHIGSLATTKAEVDRRINSTDLKEIECEDWELIKLFQVGFQ